MHCVLWLVAEEGQNHNISILWVAPLSLCVNEMISVLQEMKFWNSFSITGNWIVTRACFKKNKRIHDVCLARKAPNPILIVLWAHLPSCEGDFDSEDESVVMLFKAKQLLQQEGSERGVPQAVLPSLSQALTKANNAVSYCPLEAAGDLASWYHMILLLLGLSLG